MEENKEQLQEETIPAEPHENISLGDAMSGVFSEPGDTYTAVKNSTKKNYWLIPILILVVISILCSILVMRDEELVASIKEKQTQAIKERLDEQVKEGNMTREQADQQMEQSEKMFSGGMMMIFGIIGSIFAVVVFFFLKALINWGGLKIFKGTATYVDNMNVLGLASLITSIQMVVNTVLAVVMGKLMMNIGPVLLVSEASVGKNMFTLLANMDIINIWYMIVVGIGLAKVSNLKTSITLTFTFVIWLIWVLLTSFGPLGMFSGR